MFAEMKSALFPLLAIACLAATQPALAGHGLSALESLDHAELSAVFADGIVDGVPVGDGQGLALLAPEFELFNSFASHIWTGKVISANGTLENKVLGAEFVRARVYEGYVSKEMHVKKGRIPSFAPWFRPGIEVDGKPSIILNYSDSEIWAARGVVDEMRRVLVKEHKGLYLGRAMVFGQFYTWFALEFPEN